MLWFERSDRTSQNLTFSGSFLGKGCPRVRGSAVFDSFSGSYRQGLEVNRL